jgi:hypothetical protein
MDAQRIAVPVSVNRPYKPTANPLRPGVWRDGCNVFLRGSDLTPESARGLGATALANVGSGQMFIDLAEHPTLGITFVKMTTGSAAPWRKWSLFYCGSGSVYWGSSSAFDTASSTLKVRIYNETNGSFTNLVVGMNAPNAPTLQAADGLNGRPDLTSLRLTGTRSCRIAEANSQTGWVSNRSASSEVVQFNHKQALVTYPSLTNVLSGADGFYLYFTPAGLGTGNAFFQLGGFVAESTLQVTRRVAYDFNDNDLDLTRPAPVTHDPPPSGGGSHVVAFDLTIILMGTYLGAGLSPSDVDSNGGSFDPLKTTYASPFERMTGVWPRPASGFALFGTKNSLQAVYIVGGEFIIAVRQIWGQNGIPGGRKGGVYAGQNFYAYTNGGPARLVGDNPEPETDFALDVQDLCRRNFNSSDVCMAYDPQDKLVLVCGLMSSGVNSGWWVALPYRTQDGQWSLPIRLPGKPEGAVTISDQLYLVIGGALLAWEGGGGLQGGVWRLRSGGETFGHDGYRASPRRATTAGNSASITARLYNNSAFTGSSVSWSSGAAGYGEWKPIHMEKADVHGFELEGNAAGQQPWATVVEVDLDPRQQR